MVKNENHHFAGVLNDVDKFLAAKKVYDKACQDYNNTYDELSRSCTCSVVAQYHGFLSETRICLVCKNQYLKTDEKWATAHRIIIDLQTGEEREFHYPEPEVIIYVSNIDIVDSLFLSKEVYGYLDYKYSTNEKKSYLYYRLLAIAEGSKLSYKF